MTSPATPWLPDWPLRRALPQFLALLGLLLALLYRDFLFGGATFVFTDFGDDSYTLYYPQMQQQLEALARGELPGWSFATGLGRNTYPFWLRPLATPLLYLFFRDDVPGGMVWTQLLYSLLASLSMFAWLRVRGLHALACTLGGLLYAGCGYVLVYGSWCLFEWSETYLHFALLLLALELLLQRGRWELLVLVGFLLAVTYPFHLYFAALVAASYLAVRWADGAWQPDRAGWSRVLRGAVAGLLGVGLGGFLLLSNLAQMQASPRGSGEFAYTARLLHAPAWQPADAKQLATLVLRLFGNNLQGGPDAFTGWQNYFEAPVLYCGLLALLLVPQRLVRLSRRQRLVYGGLLAGFGLVAAFPYLRHALWLFTGDYYRVLSLWLVLGLLLLSAQALSELLRGLQLHRWALGISCAVAGVLLVLTSGYRSPEASPSVIVVGALLLGYAGLLTRLGRAAWQGRWAGVLLAATVLELLLVAVPAVSERKTLARAAVPGRPGYADATLPALAYLRQHDPGFYRVEKNYYSGVSRVSSYDEALVQHFHGSRSYHPFNNLGYVHFLASLGAVRPGCEPRTRWLPGLLGYPQAMQLCGVRYLLSAHDSTAQYQPWGFEPLAQVSGVTLLRNHRAWPLGTCFSRYLPESAFARLDSAARQQALLRAVVVPDRLVPALAGLQAATAADLAGPALQPTDTLRISSFSANDIRGQLSLPARRLLFFAIPVDTGWSLLANGQPVALEPVFGGLLGAVLPAGEYMLRLQYQDPYVQLGTLVSGLSLGLLLLLVGHGRWQARREQSADRSNRPEIA
jgi:Bacterial membrane protein YfhO